MATFKLARIVPVIERLVGEWGQCGAVYGAVGARF